MKEGVGDGAKYAGVESELGRCDAEFDVAEVWWRL